MNASKFETLHRSITTTARKVFDATPANETWTPQMVYQELHRKGHSLKLRQLQTLLKSIGGA